MIRTETNEIAGCKLRNLHIFPFSNGRTFLTLSWSTEPDNVSPGGSATFFWNVAPHARLAVELSFGVTTLGAYFLPGHPAELL